MHFEREVITIKTFENIKKIYKYAKEYNRYLFLYLICIPFVTFISVVVPLFTAKQIVYINNSLFTNLINASIVILMFEILRNVTKYVSSISLELNKGF